MYRAYLILDTHQVELPNHPGALENLDLTNARLLIVRVKYR